jgi:hypothetical protein
LDEGGAFVQCPILAIYGQCVPAIRSCGLSLLQRLFGPLARLICDRTSLNNILYIEVAVVQAQLGRLTEKESEMPTYKQVLDHLSQIGVRGVATCHIAHVKSELGLTRGPAHNRHSPTSRIKPCPPSKRLYIERALRDLGAI